MNSSMTFVTGKRRSPAKNLTQIAECGATKVFRQFNTSSFPEYKCHLGSDNLCQKLIRTPAYPVSEIVD
jgi:hypothetical protein